MPSMVGRRTWQLSLANKCRLLFGLAVLLILAAALAVPWIRLNDLYKEINRLLAARIAEQALAALEANPGIWETGRPGVEVLNLETIEGAARAHNDPFINQAIKQMRGPARRESAFRIERDRDGLSRCRYLLALRDVGEERKTGRLLGIISVTTPLQEPTILFWNRAVVLAAGVLAGVLAMMVFYLITQRFILSPVRALRTVAEQVGDGDMSVRASIATRDEFEELSDAFNQMLANINKSHEELQKINRSLDTRLGELAETNVALYEANRLKNAFLANVTHELRTPMTSIIGFAELLRDAGEDKDGRIRRYAGNILTSGRMLLDLINDLLDLAKIEAGKIDLHRTQCPLKDTCEALLDFIRPLADKKGIELSLTAEGEWPTMHSDAGKIKQILYNLLSNAIKFTPVGGRAGIAVRQLDGDHVEVRVSDTGPGIPPEQRDSIFEQFTQIDGSVTREHGGTGLGLAISRGLTRALGGTLTLAELVQGQPQGAVFIVVLPLTCPESAAAPPLRLN